MRNSDDADVRAAVIFMQRMLLDLLLGVDFGTAGQAVLAQDWKLAAAALEDSESGREIRRGLASEVYEAVRRQVSDQRQQVHASESERERHFTIARRDLLGSAPS